ncbi:MAG: hypothetical protein EON54_00750 [Alcaligenaceae bacterium]|nr:MAG: hypothetical protein EON54_00750 [Alcaligenaceae bacterium]
MAVVFALTACANRPESIQAYQVPQENFAPLECPALQTLMTNTRADLEKFSKMQDDKANGDAVGVLLLGIPFSKVTGDHESDVARLKGEVDALEIMQVTKSCG